MKLRVVFILLFSIVLGSVLSGQKSNKKITISGYVVDANQNPVARATIVIDKKNTRTVTDIKGFYELKVRPDAGMISVFVLNNKVWEALIERKTNINITLKEITSSQNNQDNIKADSLLIIGYDSVDSKKLTKPIKKSNAKENKYDSFTTIYELIKFTVPGVTVIGTSINIQNASFSLNASTEPLFIVNGIPVTSIGNITPTDVKSIQLIKGSSAAMYGLRGANGVILINLKTGDYIK